MPITFICARIEPAVVSKCRRTTITAIGEATVTANTAYSATNQAHAEARRQSLEAAKQAKMVRCPEFGGCDEKCRQDRTSLAGIFSPTVTDRRKLGPGLWQVSSRARRTFDVNCRCPKPVTSKKKSKPSRRK